MVVAFRGGFWQLNEGARCSQPASSALHDEVKGTMRAPPLGEVHSGIELAYAAEDELEAIRVLDALSFSGVTYPYFVLKQLWTLFPRLTLVARQVEPSYDLLAYALGGVAPPRTAHHDQPVGWVLAMATAPAARGQGLARALLEHLVEGLEQLGVAEVLLTVAPHNRDARALYESEGFGFVEHVADYFGPGEDRLILRRPVFAVAR